VCELTCFDYAWFGTVVNHICSLLVTFAEDADQESGFSEKLKLEETKNLLLSLFRTLQVANNDAPDNRKFITFYIINHILKIDFIRKNFNEAMFKWVNRAKSDGYSTDRMPKAWQIDFAYYTGRWHMFASNYVEARLQYKQAF